MKYRRQNRVRQAAIAVASAVLVTGGAYVVHDLTNNPAESVPQAHRQAPEKPQVLNQTDQQRVNAALGPFETLAVPGSEHPDTHYPAVLLLRQDGSMAASTKWTTAFTPTSWAKQDVFQISKLMPVGKYVDLESATGRVYRIRCGQPFLLEGVPQQILLVDQDGQQWSTPASRANLIRRSL